MRMLSLDLFSGVGGITHALRGIAEPVAYCDVWNVSRDVLRARMEDGDLPSAPISSDVRALDAAWLASNVAGMTSVDMVVGGFPCVGFSTSGLRKGFENEQSGLFQEVLRILDEFSPRFVFLENVQNILSIGMTTVSKELVARGFQYRYCSLPAFAVGAPQRRMRWFCLAYKRAEDLAQLRELAHSHPIQPFSWGEGTEPRRMAHEHAAGRKKRIALLGNSVVPDCVRYAFDYLVDADREVAVCMHRRRPHAEGRTWPNAAVLDAQGRVFRLNGPQTTRYELVPSYVLDPNTYVFPKEKVSRACTSTPITAPVARALWPTPRHGSGTASHVLTERSSRDIETFARFEVGTADADRTGQMRGEFAEWLMGYPEGWTLPCSRKQPQSSQRQDTASDGSNQLHVSNNNGADRLDVSESADAEQQSQEIAEQGRTHAC